MNPFTVRVIQIVGAVVAVLLQVMAAPNIQILDAAPNFILCWVIAVAVANARAVGYVMPFLLGLIYDLISTGAVGSMAFVCLAATFVASVLLRLFDNETVFIPVVIVVVVCLLSEVGYALLTLACGLDVDLLESLVSVALPCAVYDIVLAVITYLLVKRFVFRDQRPNEMTILDSKIG